MSDQTPDDRPPPQLQYRSDIDERHTRPRVPIIAQAIIAAITSCASIALGVLLGILSTGAFALPVMLAILAAVFFAIVAIALKQDPKTRGWAIGIWIGLALAGLLEGICFLSFGI